MTRSSSRFIACLAGLDGRRRSFTLTELMLVTAIITVLATTTLFALFGVVEQAKQTRTEAQIQKIHELIMQRWESYRTRKIPILIPPNASAAARARVRLHAIRDLMRMELPDRITDLEVTPVPYPHAPPAFAPLVVTPPSLWHKYRRHAGFSRTLPALANWPAKTTVPPNWDQSTSHQQAECLYLILAAIQDGDTTALDFFKSSEIGDTDEDGMPEILDAWGRPIQFLRWAPGFATTPGPDDADVLGTNPGWGVANVDDDGNNIVDDTGEMGWPGSDDRSELQDRDAKESPDIFDPLRRDPRWDPTLLEGDKANDPFMLYPLVFSAGADGIYDIATEISEPGSPRFYYALTKDPFNSSVAYPNDPYVVRAELNSGLPRQIGQPLDVAGDGELNSLDNITNHLQQAE